MLMIFGQPSRCGREGSKAAGEHEQRIAAGGGTAGARRRSREARRRCAGGGTYILFQLRAFPAVERIRDAHPAADDAAPSVRAVVSLVADAHESAGAHQRVAHHALAVACAEQGGREAAGQGEDGRKHRARASQKGAAGRQQDNAHFSHSRPIAMPGCFLHITRSGWCFAIPRRSPPPASSSHTLNLDAENELEEREESSRRGKRRRKARVRWKLHRTALSTSPAGRYARERISG